MSTIEKAKAQLEDNGVTVSKAHSDTVYVFVEDMELELSEREIKFQAEQYDATEHA